MIGEHTTEKTDARLLRKAHNSRLLREDQRAARDHYRGWPEVLGLHTSEVCNLRCVMCDQSTRPGWRKLDRGTLAGVLEQLFPTAWKAIVSPARGEPLLSDFDLILPAAERHRVRLDLVTNGQGLNLDTYRAARGVLDHLNISVDSAVPEVYERLRVGASFARLRRNLEAIGEERASRRDGVVLSLSAVVMRSTLPHLPELLRFAGEVGADAVVLQPLRQFHHECREEELWPADGGSWITSTDVVCRSPQTGTGQGRADFEQLVEELRARSRHERVNLYFADFDLAAEEPRPLRRALPHLTESRDLCWSVARNLALMPTGDVYPCSHPTDLALGNLMLDPLERIWNGPAARRLRRAHFSGRGTSFCDGCLHARGLGPARKGRAAALAREGRLTLAHLRNAARRRLGLRSRR